MHEYFDTLETRDPDMRERAQLAALREQVAYAKAHTSAYAALLADVDPRDLDTRAALERLPVVRKADGLSIAADILERAFDLEERKRGAA